MFAMGNCIEGSHTCVVWLCTIYIYIYIYIYSLVAMVTVNIGGKCLVNGNIVYIESYATSE